MKAATAPAKTVKKEETAPARKTEKNFVEKVAEKVKSAVAPAPCIHGHAECGHHDEPAHPGPHAGTAA